MLRFLAGLVVVSISLCSASYGQSAPAFEFRSHRIGDSLDVKYPQWKKGTNYLSPGCEINKEIGIVHCDDKKFRGPAHESLGGVVVFSLKYGFLDGKLYNVDVWLHSLGRYGMLAMLQDKYGAPASRSEEMITWDFREGTLRLDIVTRTPDRSQLVFENPMAEREILLRQIARTKEKQKGVL